MSFLSGYSADIEKTLRHCNDDSNVVQHKTVKLAVVTSDSLWAELLILGLKNFKTISDANSVIIRLEHFQSAINQLNEKNYDVIIISLPSFGGSEIDFVKALRRNNDTPVLMVCSYYNIPSLQDLLRFKVQGIVSTISSIQHIEEALSEVISCCSGGVRQQYIRVIEVLDYIPVHYNLSEQEIEILKLVASDLTDQEIAIRLETNTRAINYQLGLIYAKLGVERRAGAVGEAISRGLIAPHSILTSKLV